MKFIKQTAEYTIFQRNDERYAVRGKGRKWVNGDKKIEILIAEGLRKKPEPKPEPPAEEDSGSSEESQTE